MFHFDNYSIFINDQNGEEKRSTGNAIDINRRVIGESMDDDLARVRSPSIFFCFILH